MGGAVRGVEVRETSIRLFFVFEGQRYRETLTVAGQPMKPTPANIKYASRLLAKIREAIRLGTFVFAEYFPDSKNAERACTEAQTFGQIAQLWLDSKGQLKAATRDQYENAVGVWKRILGEHTLIDRLDHKQLAAKIGKHTWASPKSANNYLIVLRGILAFEYSGPRAASNPMAGIRNFKRVKTIIDPLTRDERDKILDDMRRHYDERVVAYFQWAFYTGMRPEEIIALRWGDIDFGGATVRIQRVRTFRGSERAGTKTDAERDVDLVAEAMAALRMMKPHTFMKGA